MLRRSQRSNRRYARPNSNRATTRAAWRACEPLENRLLFTTFTVTGTAAADTISLSVGSGFVIANVNGNITTQPDTLVTDVVISAGGSNDTIAINSNSNNSVVVNAGSGDDTIQIAPTTQNLDNITDTVAINGELGIDTVIVSDQAVPTGANYHFTNGNELTRDGSSTITYSTAEQIDLSEGTATFHLAEFTAPSTTNVAIHGGNAGGRLNWIGSGSESVVYTPSATTPGSGNVQLAGGTAIEFDHLGFFEVRTVSNVQFVTPNSNDALSVGQVNATKNKVTGSSGGVSVTELDVQAVTQLQLNMAANDGANPNDSVVLTGTMAGTDRVEVSEGDGANTLTVSGGPWLLNAHIGVSLGTNLDVIDNGADVTFQGLQTLHRLEINNGGTVSITGATGTVLSTPNLAVTSGEGNVNLANGQGFSGLGGGTFSIGANCTLNKLGAGTLSVASNQSHGVNSTLFSQAGVLFLITDAGTAASRTLNLISSGTTNLVSSQHLASTIAAAGVINMSNNGNRVLVTTAVNTGSESGAINLGDNDMIIDYSGATPFGTVKLMLRIGRDHGLWDGLGINSSAAHDNALHNTGLGLMEATDFKAIYGGAAPFAGQTIDTTALLMKYTYNGDADFNGKVNFDDYVRTDNGFNNHRTGWVNGDYDYNDAVNFDDYVLIDSAFNTQGAVLRGGAAGGFSGGSDGGRTLADLLFA